MQCYHALIILPALGLLSACGSDSDKKDRSKLDAQVTETRMNNIDKIEGTINDDMIDVNEDTESAPLAKNDKKGSSNKDGSE